MNRNITNIIRFVMDELIPPFIRDSKLFMWPFYCIAYRCHNINNIMDFKSRIYKFSDQEYEDFYSNLNSISRHRKTDLNSASIKRIISQIDPRTNNLLDVGCSSGYLLKRINDIKPKVKLYGTDIISPKKAPEFQYVQANIRYLPFSRYSFDIVTCNHTLEHIIQLEQSFQELCRITRHKLVITIPCQRYYYYTLDEHINFFTDQEIIYAKFRTNRKYSISCDNIQGDWIIILDFKDYHEHK